MPTSKKAYQKTTFKKLDTPLALGDTETQYTIEQTLYIKDIDGVEVQLEAPKATPIDRDEVLAQLDEQITGLQEKRKELTDLDVVVK